MKKGKAQLKIDCDCGCTVLEVEKWEDDWGIASIIIYKMPHSGWSLWWKIKKAWEVLWKGEAYCSDLVVLDEDIENLRVFLQNLEKLK